MKRKRHDAEQIIRKLREADAMLAAGKTIGQVVQCLEISEQTFHRWRAQYGGMKAEEAKRLKELEDENKRLKKLLAEAELDKAILKEALEGKSLSPARRRQAVEHVQAQQDVSQRRACQVLGQPRSTQRYAAKKDSEEEQRLVARLHELARQHPRYGYRMITAKLRQEGWQVNFKRIYRLWRREGFKVPRKTRKKRRLGHSGNSCVRRRAEHTDHVWTWDFIHDRTATGQPLKWFAITDEYTRECLALEVGRSITADRVLDILTNLFLTRGVPEHIRSDNGPEFIATAIRRHGEQAGLEMLYIEPGAPWENGFAESFFSRLRDELLNTEEFMNLAEARWFAQRRLQEHNHERPHSSLGYQTPVQFAAAYAVSASASATPQPTLQQHTRTQDDSTFTQPVLS